MKKIPKTVAEWKDFGPGDISVNKTTQLRTKLCFLIKETHFIETSCYLLRLFVQTGLSPLRVLQLPHVLILPFDLEVFLHGHIRFVYPTLIVAFSVTLYVTLPHPTDVCQNDRKKPFPPLSSHKASFMPYVQLLVNALPLLCLTLWNMYITQRRYRKSRLFLFPFLGLSQQYLSNLWRNEAALHQLPPPPSRPVESSARKGWRWSGAFHYIDTM